MKKRKKSTKCGECGEVKLCSLEFYDFMEQYVCDECLNKKNK